MVKKVKNRVKIRWEMSQKARFSHFFRKKSFFFIFFHFFVKKRQKTCFFGVRAVPRRAKNDRFLSIFVKKEDGRSFGVGKGPKREEKGSKNGFFSSERAAELFRVRAVPRRFPPSGTE